jgi:ornithine carbamoyltransferase
MNPSNVPYRHLWSHERLTSYDLQLLLNTAAMLKRAGQRADGWAPLRGRHVALLCSGASGVAPAFQRAVTELGGTASLLNADEWRARAGDRIPEAARLLGRLYDAIDCCDLPAEIVEQIEAHSGVPVFNGLGKSDHPMALLGDFLTMREAMDKPLHLSRLDVTAHGPSDAVQPAVAMARLAGMQVLLRDGVLGTPDGALQGPADEPDFILDTSSSAVANRLTQPRATALQQAELNGKLAANRQCTLQAAIVCGLQ